MSQNHVYQVVFTGRLRPDAERKQVEASLVRLFKATPQQVAWLLRGVPVVVKRTTDAALADRYVRAMHEAGLICEVRAADPVTGATAAATAATASPAPAREPAAAAPPHQSTLPGFSTEAAVAPAPGRIRTPLQARQDRPVTAAPPASSAPVVLAETAPYKPQVIPSTSPRPRPATPSPVKPAPATLEPEYFKPRNIPKASDVQSPAPAAGSGSRRNAVLAVMAAMVVGVGLAVLLFVKNQPAAPTRPTTPAAAPARQAPAPPAPVPVPAQPVFELLKGHWLCLDNSFGKMGEIVFTPEGGYHAMTYGNPDSPVLSEAIDVQIGGSYTVEGSRVIMHVTDIPSRRYFGRSTQADEYATGVVLMVSESSMSWSFTARGYTETAGCMRAYPAYGRGW